MDIYTIVPSKEAKKIALARLEGEVLDWMRDHGDTFPELRDLCHEIETTIDQERQQL
ncbi:hypothetical protein [Corynebacterium sp. KPL3806]|jgi:hypothetical protein|uniref:hypothetical protein n=1 Tax=unclassified Corynebacterium TaxID=2624378 RepID=UPI0020663514|nr:MAG TPA: hypothetical protein [Caudoviricetes sp.]